MRQPAGIDRALVDFGVLGDWMDRQGLPHGEANDAEQLAGGTQNVMVRFSRGAREYVLRRPPRHPRDRSNEVLRREIRVLQALSGSDVPCPELIASCADESVMGVVFYLMTRVEGFNPGTMLPRLHADDPAVRHQMGLTAVEALAGLGSVDYEAVGLDGLGRPEGFLDRQVPRWQRELASYAELDGYPGPRLPGLDEVADWLVRNQPGGGWPGVMHGDYHLANLMYSWDGPKVAAIVDWEMCTVGDPLLDLGRFLAAWPTESEPMGASGAIYEVGGLPTHDQLVARYAASSDRDLGALEWYVVLACFKLGIILEGTFARACAGQAAPEVGDQLHASAVALLTRGHRITKTGN